MNSLIRLHNIQHNLHSKGLRRTAALVCKLIRIIYSCELPPEVVIGENTLFVHNGLGCVLHPKVQIGKNCRILQNVSIAGRNNRGTPVIGDNVFIGAGACILGGVIIGNNVKIGANAVVLSNLPEGSTAVGVPAKIVKNV